MMFEDGDHSPKKCLSQESMNYLYEMKQNGLLCDANIKVLGGEFGVHRNILCCCSHYFRSLFITPLNDQKKEVEVPGIDYEIMDKIIDFAYIRRCQMDEESVYDLFVAADYLLMPRLVNECIEYFKTILKPDNCIGIMLLGRNFTYNLENIARSFIMKNFVDIATKSQEIIKMDFKDFFDIISDCELNTQREEPVWECCVRWIDYDRAGRQKYVTQLMSGVRLGLLSSRYFMEQVKDHPYVVSCDEAKPLIIETLTFLYDLDMIAIRSGELRTPALALPRIPHEVLFAIGGWSEGLPQRCIETYDTRADRWIRIDTEDPAGPRAYHGTAVIDHKIYCVGGFDGMDYFNTCRVFDAVSKAWNEIAPMHSRRCYVSVAELNGFIYSMGGYDGQSRQNSVERYNPKSNQWTVISSMNAQRSDASACTLNGKIFITGGFNGTECMSSAEYYDPDTNEWTLIPNMISRRSGVSCVAYKGMVYAIGGFNGLSRMNTGERYDPRTQIWSTIREMYHPRSNFGLEIIDDMIFAIGGFNGAATISHAECYNIEQDEWLEATDMSMIRSALSVNVIKNLPNVRDYIHKDREQLMEERRQRMYPNARSQQENIITENNEEHVEEQEEVPPIQQNAFVIANNPRLPAGAARNNVGRQGNARNRENRRRN